jgi:hypothetical protein
MPDGIQQLTTQHVDSWSLPLLCWYARKRTRLNYLLSTREFGMDLIPVVSAASIISVISEIIIDDSISGVITISSINSVPNNDTRSDSSRSSDKAHSTSTIVVKASIAVVIATTG